MYITDLFPLEDLNKMVEEGYVNVQTHPTLPLSIYDYSKNCMYARMWNEVTENCRGLIVENFTGKVVARGPRKFYNYGQPEAVEYPLNTHVRVTRKEDGSMGIPWFYDGQYGVATRGSFQSDQAKHATELINSDDYSGLRNMIHSWGQGIYSPIAEIIYPSNRVVLSYGELDALIFLGCVDMSGIIQIRKLDESTNWMTLEEAIALPIPDDEEGYVLDVELTEGVIQGHLKLKGEAYIRDHKLISNLSERSIHECLSNKSSNIDSYIASMPDEWHEWCQSVVKNLYQNFYGKLKEIKQEYFTIPQMSTRKEFAEYVSKSPNRAYLFLLHDKREEDLEGEVWKFIRPKG